MLEANTVSHLFHFLIHFWNDKTPWISKIYWKIGNFFVIFKTFWPDICHYGFQNSKIFGRNIFPKTSPNWKYSIMNKIIVQNQITSLEHMYKLTKIRAKLALQQFWGDYWWNLRKNFFLDIFVLGKKLTKKQACHVLKFCILQPTSTVNLKLKKWNYLLRVQPMLFALAFLTLEIA